MAPRKKKDQAAAGSSAKMEKLTTPKIPPLRLPKSATDAVKISNPGQNVEDMAPSGQECDPKTLEFSQLLKLLQPKFISNYLERILIFLQSHNSEMCFSNIAPIQQVFLECLAKDPSNLKSDFEPYSKSIASKILNVLQSNPNLQWTCAYEIRSNEGVMVYKKQCPAGRIESIFKHPSSIPVKQLFISNSNKKKEKVSSPNDNCIPTSFKIQWLNTTLKFVKDDTQTTLMYPEMSLASAEFIFQMINKPDMSSDSYGYKSMYAPLWEAIKILSLKYEFKVTFISSSNNSATSVMLQKIRKITTKSNVTANQHITVKPMQQTKRSPARSVSVASSSTASSRDPSPQIKSPQKFIKLERKQKIIQSLSPEFIADVLNKLIEFLEDEHKASVILQSSNHNEMLFLAGLRGMVKNQYAHWIFPKVYQSVLGRISKAIANLPSLGWKLKVFWRNIDCKEGKREATYRKEPRKLKAKSKKSTADLKISETLDSKVNGKIEISKHPGEKFLEALCKYRSDDEPVSNDSSQDISVRKVEKLRDSSVDSQSSTQCETKEKTASNIVKSRDHSISSRTSNRSESLDRRAKNQIHFKSAGELTTPAYQSPAANQSQSSIEQSKSATDQSVKTSKSIALLPSLSKAKQKIFEAMSTPMDSDKGMRMMKLMGWSGGALGARGEGITEPIIPALLIKAGAGFGHVPEPKQTKQSKSKKDTNTHNVTVSKHAIFNKEKLTKSQRFQLRITVLKKLLELVRSDEDEVQISFDAGVPVKGVNFLENALLTFNGGTKFGLNKQEEISYVEQIQREMNNTKFVLSALVVNKSIIFSKSLSIKQASVQSTNKTAKQVNTSKSTDSFVTRMQNTKTSRIELLERILAFVTSETKEKEIVLNNDINQAAKKRVMLENILDVANKKKAMDCIEGKELQLFRSIASCMNEFCLTLETLNEKEYRYLLQKKYRKRFINSAINPSTNRVKENHTNNNETQKTVEFNFENDKNDEYVDSHHDSDVIVLDDSGNEYETEISKLKTTYENNNYLNNRTFDVDYEKEQFQKEIDSIEKGSTVDENGDVVTENNVASNWEDILLNEESDYLENRVTSNQEIAKKDAELTKLEVKHDTDQEDIDNNDNEKKDVDSIVMTQNKTDLEISNNDKHSAETYEDNSNEIIYLNSDNSNVNNETHTKIYLEVKDHKLELDNETSLSSKRSRSNSLSSVEKIPKITKQAQNKLIHIVPKDYPDNKISSETAKEVQSVILKTIDSTTFMPLLQCHGIKNGALVYGCGNTATASWIDNILSNLNVKLLDCSDFENEYVMEIKINSLIKLDAYQILLNLEIFNTGLDTSNWMVTDEIQNDDCVLIIVSVDEKSYSFVCERDCALYAGVDKALFRLHW